MSPTRSTESWGGDNWKAKFTDKQLERKRLVDRVGQKRTRQLLKRNLTQLEEQVHLLVQGEHKTLLRNLVNENAALRAALDQYESRMETILLCSKECLDMGQSGPKAAGPASQLENNILPIVNSMASVHGVNAIDQVCDRLLADGSLPFFTPVMFRGMAIAMQDLAVSPLLSIDYIVEHVNTWKLLNKHALGFDFLIQNLALDKEPMCLTTEKIRQRSSAKTFYADILGMLVPDKEKPSSPSEGPGTPPSMEPPSEMEFQRRAVALCACEVVSRWRPLFKTNLECISMYWAVYKFFMFLTFPCRENLLRVPPWLWPTKSQLSQEHPGFIDCLAWPCLREKLIDTWHNYNIKALMIQLVRNFEIIGSEDFCGEELPLSVASDLSGLCLDKRFEAIVFDARKWTVREPFFTRFPELQSCIQVPARELAQNPQSDTDVTKPAATGETTTADGQRINLSPRLSQSPRGESTHNTRQSKAGSFQGPLSEEGRQAARGALNLPDNGQGNMDMDGNMCDGDFEFDQFPNFEVSDFFDPFGPNCGEKTTSVLGWHHFEVSKNGDTDLLA